MALDLFCGTGGATAAFRDAGWFVIGVDLKPGPSVDVIADVGRPLPVRGPVDFLWASPPCTEFSDANPRIDHASKSPSVELVAAVLRVVAELRPRFWILENVRGAIPFLGIPAQKVGPWCLWGYFPRIAPAAADQGYRKWEAGHTAAAHAAVPYGLSRAVLRSVERHWHLPSILDLRPFRRHRHVAARRSPGGPQLGLPLPGATAAGPAAEGAS